MLDGMRLHTDEGWFNQDDDSTPALIYAEATDQNEVMVDIRAAADWGDEKPRASVHLDALQALALAKQIEQSARDALDLLSGVRGGGHE